MANTGITTLRGLGISLALLLGLGAPYALTQAQSATTPPATVSSEPNLRPYVPSRSASSAAPAQNRPAQSQSAQPRPAQPRPVTPRPATTNPQAATTTSAAPRPTTPPTTTLQTTPAPATTAIAPVAITSRPISGDDIETFTDAYVRGMMQRDHVLGVTVAVVQGNTPLLVKGYGYDSLDPVRPVSPDSSLFRIGSITKTLTWIVARQEIEGGRIKADGPLGPHLPADIYLPDPRFGDLTLNDMMNHTAGYEDTSLGHLFQPNPNRILDIDSYYRVHKPKRIREPGTFSSYSNYGPALAALALSRTSRSKDVPTMMEVRIFQPLGLNHTTLREPYAPELATTLRLPAPLSPDLARDLSGGFVWDGAGYSPQPFDYAIPLSGALSGASTANDMGRLMSLMLGGGQIDGISLYNPQSAQAFRTPMLKMPEGYNGWASGLRMRTLPSGLVTYGHGGSTLWFNSSLILVPELNIGIFISTNTQTGAHLANSYPLLLLEHLESGESRPPLSPTPAMARDKHRTQYDAIDGMYVSSRRAYGGLEGAVTRLLNTVRVSFDADGRLTLSGPGGASTYLPVSAPGFFVPQDATDTGPAQDLGGLHFLFDDSGTRVSAFETASNMARFEKVGWLHKPGTLGLLTSLQVAICIGMWLSLLKPSSGRHDRPTEAQMRATIISAATALLWLLAIFVFHVWKTDLLSNPDDLFTRWPSGQVRLASWLAFIATLGSVVGLANTYFAYVSDSHFHDGWPLWQKLLHGALIVWWLFYAFVLIMWGALSPWSW